MHDEKKWNADAEQEYFQDEYACHSSHNVGKDLKGKGESTETSELDAQFVIRKKPRNKKTSCSESQLNP